ncbi:MAG: VOC family protein [Bacilli bacterium]|jgi:predicted enzyme related to lactoylglutathione lyase|nr:VOC family protein [Bacilli bacterium]HHU23938.1 VOC family protein [Acholeplasmataceae bacterium]
MSISKESMMFIIYAKNQEKAKNFYESLLGYKPTLDVPGMTEFALAPNVSLGIMPETGIMRLLENKIPNPTQANGIPRCEIYLYVDNPDEFLEKLVKAGGKKISLGKLRNWSDFVSYGLDPDGNVLAFAKKVKENQ